MRFKEAVTLQNDLARSNDTFLLVKEGGSDFGFDEASIAWVGKGGDTKEMEALQKLAEKIGATEIETIEEGSESDEFWEILGGQDEYFTLPRTNVRKNIFYFQPSAFKIYADF